MCKNATSRILVKTARKFHHLLTLTLVSNIEKGSIYILSPLLSDNDDRDDIDGRLACCELVSIISSPPTPTFVKTGLDKGFVSKVAPSSVTKQCKRQQWLGAENCQRAHNRNMFIKIEEHVLRESFKKKQKTTYTCGWVGLRWQHAGGLCVIMRQQGDKKSLNLIQCWNGF